MGIRRPIIATLVALAAAPAPASAVVGGHDATRSYPHMAILKQDDGFVCGASLIAPDRILTAAHCVMESDFRTPLAPKRISFTLGTTTVNGSGETIGATEVTPHERWTGDGAGGYDIALVKLARPSSQKPIAIASPAAQRASWAAGARATVIGYGANVPILGLSYTDTLQEVDVPIVADADCFDADPTKVCAGELYGIKDSCNGDSGGPMMVGDGNGGMLLVGTVSYGFECGIPTQYGVYGRVADSTLYDWIAARVPPAGTAPAATEPPASSPAPAAKVVKKKAKAKPKKKAKKKKASCKTKKAKKLKRCRKAKRK